MGNNKIDTKIGARVFRLRDARGETQTQLARALGVTQQVVNNWEQSTRDLKTEMTVALADHFDVTCDYILRGVPRESVDIHRETGLSGDAIDTLRKFAAQYEYTEPEDLRGFLQQQIENRTFSMGVVAGVAKAEDSPQYMSDEEFETMLANTDEEKALALGREKAAIFNRFYQHKKAKEIIDTLNVLLASEHGIEVISSIGKYLDVAYGDRMILEPEPPGAVIEPDGTMWSQPLDEPLPIKYLGKAAEHIGSAEIRAMYAQKTIAAMQNLLAEQEPEDTR